jgi:DNA-binding response OmpR family regulator
MDLRVLVLVADHDLGELVRTQVENLGCRCSLAETYAEAGPALGWADAAVVDLAGDGLDDLNRLRVEAPTVRTLAIAPDVEGEKAARSAGVDQVLVEPFSIAEIADRVRLLAREPGDAEVVDLRTGERKAAPPVDDAPWWATKTH